MYKGIGLSVGHAEKMLAGVASSAIILGWVAPTYAQTAPDAEPPAAPTISAPASSDALAPGSDQGTANADIVVTGTSIRGVAPVGSPLIQINQADIQASGAQNAAALFATVPQVNSFGTRPNQGGNVNAVTPPTLRGLPDGTTLSLLDGHRIVAAGTIATFADPSSIPVDAIERVEILADGASSTYGSDAVGGVINVILRHDLNGVNARYTDGFAQGYYERSGSLVAGKTWGSGSLLLAYGYNKNSGLLGADRDYVTADLTRYGGADARSLYSSPANVVVGGESYHYTGSGFVPGASLVDDVRSNDQINRVIRHTAVASLRQDLGNHVHVFGDASYGHLVSSGRTAQYGAPITITSANPYFQTPEPGTTSETVNYRFTNELGQYNHNLTRLTYYGGSLGADIDIGAKWHGQVFGNYGHSNTLLTLAANGTINPVALQTALDSTDPATAFDPFDDRTTPATIQSLISVPSYAASVQKLYQASAKVDGPLFAIWGGDVRLAIGGEFRREVYLGRLSDPTSTTGAILNRNSSRNVYSAYGEIFAPLVSPANNVRMVHKLSIDATLRYDHYSDFGNTVNPKIGAEWAPIEPLTIRASYSRSFQAPSMADLNSTDARAQYLPGVYSPNFFTPVTPVRPYNILLLAGGNPNLQPQKARTFTVGGDLKLGGHLKLSATYFNIHFTNVVGLASGAFTNQDLFNRFITPNPTQAQIDAVVAQMPAVWGIPIPANQIDFIDDLRRYNLGVQNIVGLDFGPTVTFDPLDHTTVQVGANGNFFIKNETQPAPGAAFVDNIKQGTDRWRIRGFANVQRGPFTGNVFVNYLGAYDNVGIIPTQRVHSLTTIDLNLSYKFDKVPFAKSIVMQINAQNLLDKNPPISYTSPGYSGLASPIGRLIEATIGVQF
jgi:iron complex outermembrane recepter protein